LPLEPATPTAVAPSGSPRRFEIPDDEIVDPAASAQKPAQNNGAEATPATPEAKPEEKPEGEKPEGEVTPEQAAKREGRRFERRLDKAYRQRAEALARAELLEKQLAEVRQPKAPEGAPKLEDFDYDPEKYAAAKADFAKSQAQKEFETKQREQVNKQAQAKLLTEWEEKVSRAEDKYDDFAEVVGDLQPTNPLISAIMEAENGEDIAYHLAKHPKEAQRIANLSPFSAAREIGKLEAKLASKPEKPQTPSKAPAPITPLSGAAPVRTDVPNENDDTADWIRKRSKQVHGNRRF
jgi:hypothetical protein